MDERLAFGYGTPGRSAPPVHVVVRQPAAVEAAPQVEDQPRAVPERSEWAFTGLMLFTVLLYTRPQDLLGPLGVIPVADAAALSALAALVYSRLSKGRTVTRMTPELAGVLALAGIMLLTAPFSIWPGGAIATFIEPFLKVVLIFVLMINTLTTPKRLERFVWLMVILTSYVAGRAVFDYARGFNLIENGRVMGSVGGMFHNPNDLALNMVAILPIAVMLAMASKGSWRLAAGAGAFLMVGATVVSQSRGGFLGLAVMLVLLAIQVGRKRPAFLLAGLLTVMVALPLVPDSYWQRVSSITDDSRDATGSRESRRFLLLDSWKTFLDYPLTGVGAGNFKAHDPGGRSQPWQETHNVVLQVAAELGIFGTVVFIFLLYRGFTVTTEARRMLSRATGSPGGRRSQSGPARPAVVTGDEAAFMTLLSPAMRLAIVGWFLCALFASVAYHWTFYYLLAMAVAPREVLLDRLTGRSTMNAPLPRRRPAWSTGQ